MSVQTTFTENFIFQSTLGSGAFAKVVKAIHKRTGEQVAVKIISKKHVPENKWNKLRKEAVILEGLDHPNIVKFKNVIESDKHIYLVMELMKGSTLERLIKRRKRSKIGFTEEEIANIMKQILSAVAYIHSKGVVHRDLKPQNILVSDKISIGTVKITDFGLSAKHEGTRVLDGMCGTMIFMAPEQAAGNRQLYSSAVDIWSVGIIFYLLLAGKHPLHRVGDSYQDFKLKLSDPRIQIPSSFSDQAKNLFSKLTEFEPINRFNANQALQHPYITRSGNVIPTTLIEEMQNYQDENKVKKILFAMVFLSKLNQQKENSQDKITAITMPVTPEKSVVLEEKAKKSRYPSPSRVYIMKRKILTQKLISKTVSSKPYGLNTFEERRLNSAQLQVRKIKNFNIRRSLNKL